jgi:hypothetical protein
MATADPHWIEYLGALGGLAGVLLALVAAWYAKRSADSADKALALARDEVGMARTEHQEFLRQLQARARFRLTPRPVYPPPDDEGVLRTDAGTVTVRVEIGLKNDGERAARETVINAVIPRYVNDFRWSGPSGEMLRDAGPPSPTTEALTDAEGNGHVGQYLALILPSVTRRSHYVRYFQFSIEVLHTGRTVSVPLRVTAEADELPDDEPEASEQLMVRVIQHPPA